MKGRPALPPPLVPRQPKTELGWMMRELREANGRTLTDMARAYGCSASHLSRAERGGAKPSRELVNFYENELEGEGMLLSVFDVVEYYAEQNRRRFGGHRPRRIRSVPGDLTAYVDDNIPQGTLMKPGERFVMEWRIRNCGTVPWRGRRLERQGPLTGPGLITSARSVPIPDTDAGDVAEIPVEMEAPTYDATSIAYFKMIDSDGYLCFPDTHQMGLNVLVRVERNTSGFQDPPGGRPEGWPPSA
jgi:transcriptional regulator with XRE-family HTH domain